MRIFTWSRKKMEGTLHDHLKNEIAATLHDLFYK
jgi:hypothetical protein